MPAKPPESPPISPVATTSVKGLSINGTLSSSIMTSVKTDLLAISRTSASPVQTRPTPRKPATKAFNKVEGMAIQIINAAPMPVHQAK